MNNKRQSQRIADKICKKMKTEDLPSLVEAVKIKSPLVQQIIDLGLSNLEEKDEKGGKTALMYAVLHKDLVLVKKLISAGANTETVSSHGITALMYATIASCDVILENLLMNGASILTLSEFSDTPLIIACKKGESKLVEILVKHGLCVSVKNGRGESPLMIALQRNHIEVLKVLLSAGADVNTTDNKGESALFKIKTAEAFFLLVQAGADPNSENDVGEPILLFLVRYKPFLFNCIEHLVQSGAPLTTKYDECNTVLMEACNHSNHQFLNIVKLLVEKGVNPSTQNSFGFCALNNAIKWNHIEIVSYLLSVGANPSSQSPPFFSSLLMQVCACESENLDILNLLLEAGANVSAVNVDRQNALMFAIINEHINYVKCLLKFGANPHAQDSDGNSAFHRVCNLKPENLELFNILLQTGINPSAKNKNGKTAVMIALENEHYGILKTLIKHNCNIQDHLSKNILMTLCEISEEKVELVKLCIENGVNLNAQDSKGKTALMLAFKQRHLKIVKLLIKSGANVSTQDHTGRTLLMMACKTRQIKLVKLLIKSGACISTKDNNGETAVIIASRTNLNIMYLLLEAGACAIDKDSSVLSSIFEIYKNEELNSEFELTLQRIFNYSTEVNRSILVYELIRAYSDNWYDEDDYHTNCWRIFVKIIKQVVKEASIEFEETNPLMLYQSDPHILLMDKIGTEEHDMHFSSLSQVFDIIMNSPFKDVSYTSSLSTSSFDRAIPYDSMTEEYSFPCPTIGVIIYGISQHNENDESDLKILQNSLTNMLDNGFSIHSNDPRTMSPLTILNATYDDPQDQKSILSISKDFLARGVDKCQRLLRFVDQDLARLSELLQLPDALWYAFINGNKTVLPYLLPYWSAPPLALLLFMPPIGQLQANPDNPELLLSQCNQVFLTLVEVGGPLPPGHRFIPIIQNYLEAFAAVYRNAENLSENFRLLHSEAPPRLEQLCRHVVRGCSQSSDDLPECLSSLVPPGLRPFLTLMDN